MDKKACIIKIIEKMKPYWSLAEGVLALIKSVYMDDNTIDWITDIIGKSIKNSKENNQKDKMLKWLEKIQKIKAMEEKEKMSDSEIDQLLSDI